MSKKTHKSHKRTCAVADCSNRSDTQPNIAYHAFPKDAILCGMWEELTLRADEEFFSGIYRYICGEHFIATDYRYSLTGIRTLKPGTLPSVFKARNIPLEETDECFQAIQVAEDEGDPGEGCSFHTALDDVNMLLEPDVEPKSTTICDHESLIKHLQNEVESLRTELETQRKTSVSKFALERFSASPEDIAFYTGFPDYATLLVFWEKISPCASNLTRWQYARHKVNMSGDSNEKFPYLSDAHVKSNGGRPRTLRPIDEFFLVLVRLRLGLFERDLSHRFNISTSTVSDIIITWLNFLYIEMGSWPLWIDRATVKENLPPVFKGKYEDTIVIIDCTEFRCEVPKDPSKQSELYSEYKSHDTFKGLIGISPHVAVTFVSQLYCGQISDREITLKSGLCDLLQEGDKLMADKGFDIQDILAKRGVVLFVPPKRKPGQVQLSKEEVFETQMIARVRIHVERAIKRVKGWHIFDKVLPLTLYGSVNQIWSICCMLVNFQKPSLTC